MAGAKGTIWMSDGKSLARVPPSEVSDYLARGYKRGRLLESSRVWVHRDNTEKRIVYKNLEMYLLAGYKLGRLNPIKLLISKEGL